MEPLTKDSILKYGIQDSFKTSSNELKVKKLDSGSLTDLQNDFVFITHAAWLLPNIMPEGVDPLQVFYQNSLPDKHPFLILSSSPIFTGLFSYWNYAIIAIPNEDWPAIHLQLNALLSIDRNNAILHAAIKQRLPLLDFRSGLQPHYVDVLAYGVASNKYCLHYLPAVQPGKPIKLLKDLPLDESIQLAKKIFANHQST